MLLRLYQYHISVVSQWLQMKNGAPVSAKSEKADHLSQLDFPFQLLNGSEDHTLPSKPLLLANECCAVDRKLC